SVKIKPLPTGAASLIPNLNELGNTMNKVEDPLKEYVTGSSRENFSSQDLLKYWNEYASQIKQENKINIFTLMSANAPVLLPDFNIEVMIENKIQEDLLNTERIDLLNFLRVKLKNFSIQIQTKHAPANTKKRLYTSSEKYQHMLSKNPELKSSANVLTWAWINTPTRQTSLNFIRNSFFVILRITFGIQVIPLIFRCLRQLFIYRIKLYNLPLIHMHAQLVQIRFQVKILIILISYRGI